MYDGVGLEGEYKVAWVGHAKCDEGSITDLVVPVLSFLVRPIHPSIHPSIAHIHHLTTLVYPSFSFITMLNATKKV
jgi:hypothetical protein